MVQFFTLFEVTNDDRRSISEWVADKPCFKLRQIKIVSFKTGNQKPVGQHRHKIIRGRAGRQEIFLVFGKVTFRWRDESGDQIQEREMNTGDGCVIPPGASHSFLALSEGAVLLGFSNLPYNSADDVPDKLFWLVGFFILQDFAAAWK